MAGEHEAYIARPTDVYRAWLSRTGAIREDVGFEEGRIAMAMEIITVRRSLQAVGMLTTELVSTLDALLVDQGLIDTAEEMYEELAEWRKPKFRAEPSSPLSVQRPTRPPGLGRLSWPRRGRTKGPSPEPEEPTNEVAGPDPYD